MKSPGIYLLEQVVINLIINFVVAYYISKATLSALHIIPMQAPTDNPLHPNIGGDLLVGSFIAGLIITLVLTAITRLNLRKNKIDVSAFTLNSWIKILPESVFKRGLYLGICASLLVAMPLVVVLNIFGVEQATTSNYMVLHSIYAALLGGALTYIASKRALADT